MPALVLSVLSAAVFAAAGAGYALWVPLGLAAVGWLAVWLICRGHVRLGRWAWAAVGLGSFLIIATLSWIGIHSAQSVHRELPPACDTVIVLGTGIEAGMPGEMLQMRLDAAAEIAGRYPGAVVIPSGGLDPGETVTEAEAMAVYMENRGIDPSRIRVEPRSTDTYENLLYSKPLAQGTDTILVTSGFHTLRAGFLARWMDWDVVTVGAAAPWPESLHWQARECLALWKDTALHLSGR